MLDKKIQQKTLNTIHNTMTFLQACEKGTYEQVKRLLENGANPNEKNKIGMTAIYHACKNEGSDNIKIMDLLFNYGVDVNKAARGYNPPIFHVLKSYELVKKLLELGADPNASGSYNTVVLTKASEVSSLKTFQLLVSYGADVRNHSVLKKAVDYNNIEVVQYLLSLGLNPFYLNEETSNLYIRKFNKNNSPILDMLIKNGLDINACNSKNESFLWLAEEIEVVKKLIDSGADINILGPSNNTKLSKAAMDFRFDKSQIHIIDYLLSNGADPLIRNKKKELPIDFIITLLLGYRTSPITEIEKNCFMKLFEVTDQKLVLRKLNRNIKNIKVTSDLTFFQTLGVNPNLSIHIIIEKGDIESLRQVLNNKITKKKEYLEIAIEKQNLLIIKSLLDYGFKMDETEREKVFEIILDQRAYDFFYYIVKDLNNDSQTTNFIERCMVKSIQAEDLEMIQSILTLNVELPKDFNLVLEIFDLSLKQNNNFLMNLIIHEYGDRVINHIIGQDLIITYFYKNSNYKMMRTVLEKGADLNKCTPQGEALIHIVIKNNDIGTLRLLREYNVDLLTLNKDNDCPITLAYKYNRFEIFSLLLTWGISPNTKMLSTLYRDPLFYRAVYDGKLAFIEKLLMAGVNFHQTNDFNETALHAAYKINFKDMINKLISIGADQNIKNNSGKTPKYVKQDFR